MTPVPNGNPAGEGLYRRFAGWFYKGIPILANKGGRRDKAASHAGAAPEGGGKRKWGQHIGKPLETMGRKA